MPGISFPYIWFPAAGIARRRCERRDGLRHMERWQRGLLRRFAKPEWLRSPEVRILHASLFYGELAERLKAAVQKTEVAKVTVGSNPTLSANRRYQVPGSGQRCEVRNGLLIMSLVMNIKRVHIKSLNQQSIKK